MTVTAAPFAPPFAPSNVTVTVSGQDVSLAWTGAGLRGTYDIEGYNIYRSTTAGFGYALVTPFAPSVTTTAYTDSVPEEGKRYYYSLYAMDVMGNTSTPAYFEAYAANGLSVPAALSVTAVNAARASLTWAPNDPGEGVEYYKVFRDSSEIDMSLSASYTDFTVAPGNTYAYHVSAVRGVTETAGSGSVEAEIKPAVITNFLAVNSAEPGGIELSWAEAAAEEGITIYNIYRATEPGAASPASPLYVTHTASASDFDVVTGTVYYYSVASFRDVPGILSAEASARPVTLPAEPAGLTGTAFDSYNYLEWSAMEEYGVTAYSVYRSTAPAAGYSRVTYTAQTNRFDTGLINGTAYYYRMQSHNIYGESNTVTASYIALTPAAGTAPAAPQNITVSSSGDGVINLAWAPLSGPIIYYNIYRTQYPGADVRIMTVNAVSYADVLMTTMNAASVKDDFTYYYRVKGVNSGFDEGPYSAEVSAAPFMRPQPPQNAAAANIYNAVLLSWEEDFSPYTYDSSGRRYNIYRGVDSTDFEMIAQYVTGSYYADYGVTTDVPLYFYRIKAVDDNDNEDASTAVYSTAYTGPLAPPGTLVATPGDSRVTLVWTKINPQSYNIYRRAETESYGAPLNSAPITFDVKEYTDTDPALVNGEKYYYVITAVNDAGEGPRSNEVSAVPYSPLTIADRTVIMTIENKKDVALSWQSAQDGTYAVQNYRVMRSADGGAVYTTLTITADTEFADIETDWDNVYLYMIRARDSAGNEDAVYNIVKVELALPDNRLRVFSNMVDFSKGESLRLRYFIVKQGTVKISIHTLSGAFVKRLVETEFTGELSLSDPYESPDIYWDGTNQAGKSAASGVYLIMLELDGVRVTEKVAVVR